MKCIFKLDCRTEKFEDICLLKEATLEGGGCHSRAACNTRAAIARFVRNLIEALSEILAVQLTTHDMCTPAPAGPVNSGKAWGKERKAAWRGSLFDNL
jgi:hypothetical protein